VLPWLAHAYTALGAAAALLATLAVFAGDFRTAFLWLVAATAIDASDGVLARALRVKERLPWFDGTALDNLVDFLTYVFVPVLIVIRADLLPPQLAVGLGCAVLMASGYGFSRADAKVISTDYFFTGFPSYWNIVALYMYAWGTSRTANAVILTVLVLLVFVPVRYVYPSRTVTLRPLTLVLGLSWGVGMTVVAWQLPAPQWPWLWGLVVFPVYYVVLSAWLSAAERKTNRHAKVRSGSMDAGHRGV